MDKHHVILGKGNLALALQRELVLAGQRAVIMGRDEKIDFPCPLAPIGREENIEAIWNCVGAGGVDAADKFPIQALMAHVGLTQALMNEYPKTKQIHVGSLYADAWEKQEGASYYAFTKWAQQELLKPALHGNFALVRVTNLYGWDFPVRSLPFKIAKAALTEGVVRSARNGVLPTSVEWVSKVMVSSYLHGSLVGQGRVLDLVPWGEAVTPAVMAGYLVDHGVEFVVRDMGIDRRHPDQTMVKAVPGCPIPHESLYAMMSRALREARKEAKAEKLEVGYSVKVEAPESVEVRQ